MRKCSCVVARQKERQKEKGKEEEEKMVMETIWPFPRDEREREFTGAECTSVIQFALYNANLTIGKRWAYVYIDSRQ